MSEDRSSANIKNIPLPELGEGVTSGELVKWLVSEGDNIHTDQVLAEVMTDKAAMEVSSPYEGVVANLMVKEGETVEVGRTLLTLKGSDKIEKTEQSVTDLNTLKASQNSKTDEVDIKDRSQAVSFKESDDEFQILDQNDVLATPFTRRLAKKLGIDLNLVKGSGLAGRITKEDIEQYSAAKISKPSSLSINRAHSASSVLPVQEGIRGHSIPIEKGQERNPLKGIRKKIAEKMQLSNVVIPHFTLLESANMEKVESMKNSIKDMLSEKSIKVTYLSFVMKALLKVVTEFPELNASIDDNTNETVIKKYYHFGFAADTPRGLLVPVIKNIDKKSLTAISVEIQELAVKAREGRIKPEEMSGGTITITNIGSLGGEYATPIINAPETAILGMYRLFVKPHWDGSAFQPRKTMNFSLTCDHRLIDGAVSARALKAFINIIENPFGLFI